MTKTYRIRLILRPGGGVGPDSEREAIVRARDGRQARRALLEHAWSKGWIVGRFCSIELLEKGRKT